MPGIALRFGPRHGQPINSEAGAEKADDDTNLARKFPDSRRANRIERGWHAGQESKRAEPLYQSALISTHGPTA